MNQQTRPSRRPVRHPGRHVLVAGALLASLLSSAGGSPRPAQAAPPYCAGPEKGTCLPTPAECATGNFNGRWGPGDNPSMIADCVGFVDAMGQRHIAHYVAGNATSLCGMIVENDRVLTGLWHDPNSCFRTPERAASDDPLPSKGTRYRDAVSGAGGVVAAISEAASQAGLDMLAAGGNAVDAAVAAVFAVGVTNPETCGIGAGGFLVARMADGRVRTLDFRETAPRAMNAQSLSVDGINQWGTGHRVVGVPGTVAGMAEALRVLGTKRLAETISAAERLAREGTEVAMSTANEYIIPTARNDGPKHEERLKWYADSARIYLHNGIFGYFPGAILKQADYARSLRLIATYGPEAFYQGKTYAEGKSIGRLIAEDMERSRVNPVTHKDRPAPEGGQGLMTADDLAAYRPVWRSPLRSTYRGYDVLSVPPPNAGGIQVQEILNIVRAIDLTGPGHSTVDRFHVLVEAQKLARADRDAYVADPDFRDVPTAQLTSPGYAAKRAAVLNRKSAQEYEPGEVPGYKTGAAATEESAGHSTTHVSVVDGAGNAVAVTCTLEQAFGSAVVAPGTGFLLNNQLSDFSDPGSVNEPAGGKRPRSNTAPTIVVRDGRPVLVAGGMGGPTIPMGVVHVISNVVDFGMDIAHAVDAARVFPASKVNGVTQLYIEDARLPSEVVTGLTNSPESGGKGHVTTTQTRLGEYGPFPIMQVATNMGGTPAGSSDTRSDYGARVRR